eukprot:CAMPEP_0116956018 /NCGR_PEP_ID=MMETSP0467-20121206/43041_1 /TAXON_ID=283647 /ORGANISM="Mesodinium pulex, Strain SPMC105" /LENGTH=132 /DNA_ID=CAMNT_0004642327 /DNA_START=530 /DNA_END=928 /DNA_ORIENTATION=-
MRLTRAKGFISEDDLDKATCWVHDVSDVINLHEIAEIAKAKDIKNKDLQNEIKLLKRDLDNCTDNLKALEVAEQNLREENLRLKHELDNTRTNLDESLLINTRAENENERLHNKLRLAHGELRKRLDEFLLD